MKKIGSQISPHLSRCTHIPTLPDHITIESLHFKVEGYSHKADEPKRLKLRTGLRMFKRPFLVLNKDGSCEKYSSVGLVGKAPASCEAEFS